MSEISPAQLPENPVPEGLSVPPTPDFSTTVLQGGMQQILSQNLGQYVICEFMTGNDTKETRAGILYYVGASYLVLFDDADQNYLLCDTYPLRFVTFTTPEQRPADEPPAPSTPQATPAPTPEPAQPLPPGNQLTPLNPTGIRPVGTTTQAKAAFNYARRKTRP